MLSSTLLSNRARGVGIVSTIIGIIILLFYHHPSVILLSTSIHNIVSSIFHHVQSWDMGNAIAALVAVCGYLTEHLFSRKQVSYMSFKCFYVMCVIE
jgi:hypothetical protein